MKANFQPSFRFCLLLMVVCAAPSLLMGQTAIEHDGEDKTGVIDSLKEREAGMASGFTEKRITRLGDRFAAIIIESYSLEELRKEPTAKAVAELIALSFSDVRLVENEIDKRPKMSLLLLTYLNANHPDAAESEAIEKALKNISAIASGAPSNLSEP